MVREDDLAAAIASMVRLNRRAAELAGDFGLHSATDITGYGLLGHAAELAENSGVGLRLSLAQVPLLPGALEYSRQEIVPGGLNRNRSFLLGAGTVRLMEGIDAAAAQLLFDPQTSGGLLFAVPPERAAELRERFAAAHEPLWQIGEGTEGAGIEVHP